MKTDGGKYSKLLALTRTLCTVETDPRLIEGISIFIIVKGNFTLRQRANPDWTQHKAYS